MRFANRVVVVASIALLAGCAAGGGSAGGAVGGGSIAAPTGRYMQFKDPASGVVASQITWPTNAFCAGSLSQILSNPPSRNTKPFVSCVSSSASASLNARSTIRNKLYSYIVDVEAINVDECFDFVQNMFRTVEAVRNLEVVAECALK